MQTILVCDDDKQIVEAIDIYLTGEGFQVIKAYDGYEALELLENNSVDLMIVDVMMPGLDGIRTTLKVRETSSIPIIILSAKSEDADKILGLNIGADDYIVKPFDSNELVARVGALLRRCNSRTDNSQNYNPTNADHIGTYVEYDNLVVNISNYTVTLEGKNLEMPPKELELLYFLASRPNQVFTREQLLDKLWGYEYVGDTRTVDVHIKRLREKLTDKYNWSIFTVWGIGYKFEVK